MQQQRAELTHRIDRVEDLGVEELGRVARAPRFELLVKVGAGEVAEDRGHHKVVVLRRRRQTVAERVVLAVLVLAIVLLQSVGREIGSRPTVWN